MDAEYAFRAYPLFRFFFQKIFDALVFDIFQVVDLANAVAYPVAFIKMLKAVAGKFLASKAKIARSLQAKADLAMSARFRLVFFHPATTVARMTKP